MSEAKEELVRDWLLKAQGDLIAARKLAAEPDPRYDAALFHCQQAAEKAVKGFLVLHDLRFEKTHDVGALLERAAAIRADFSSLVEDGEFLSPYATAFRYPGQALAPTSEEFGEAYQAAERICRFVVSTVPGSYRPT